MSQHLTLSLTALIALIPSILLPLRRDHRRDPTYWLVLLAAVAGPGNLAVQTMAGSWQTGFSTTLWVTVAATMAAFVATAAVTREAWRLTPLVAFYMLCLGIMAMIWTQAPARPLGAAATSGWIGVHIAVSVVTYALATLGAVAALAAFLQERALKHKRPTRLTHLLPSVADCDDLQFRLLVLAEIVLAMGLATGMAIQLGETGAPLTFDHKTVLTVAAFGLIAALLYAHYRSGLRGRKAARFVLLAYLLLTLGYPGVKFVTDVILA